MFIPSVSPDQTINTLSAAKEAIEQINIKRYAVITFLDDEMRNRVGLVSEIATAKLDLLRQLSAQPPASRNYPGIQALFREKMNALHGNSMEDFQSLVKARDHYMKEGKMIKLDAAIRKELQDRYSISVKTFLDAQDLTVADESDIAAKIKHHEEELKSTLSVYQDLLDSKTPLAEEAQRLEKQTDRLAKEKYDASVLKIKDIFTACQFGFVSFIQQACNEFWLSSSCKKFLETPNSEGFAPLHFAAYHGNVHVIHALADAGVDVDQKDSRGYTAIHWAAKAGQLPAVQALKAKGANVNAKGEYGRKPLHMSAFNSNLQVTEWIIHNGGLINEKTNSEDHAKPPFFEAVIHGDIELAKVFLKQPSLDVNAVDAQGCSALHHAVSNGLTKLIPLILGHINWKYPPKDNMNHPKKLLELSLRYNTAETKRLINEFIKTNPEK